VPRADRLNASPFLRWQTARVRIRIDLAYDGTDFHGWAAQPGLRTVQGDLEAALSVALRQPRVGVVCAGRTDTGVHARGQVVHLDVDGAVVAGSAGRSQNPPLEALVRRLNGILQPDVRVRRAVVAPAGFDARFSALWRRYAYRVADDPAVVDPLTRNHVLVWSKPLDLQAMNEAAGLFLGEHDFASFCRRREGATTIRTLQDLQWVREPDGVAVATVRADAFCHSMVRALVGCLLAIGDGRRPVAWAGEVLRATRRDPSVTVAHAHGLTLEQVAYPADEGLAHRADVTRARRVATGMSDAEGDGDG
jgi:tRNA pseudouridine38-40 synthase